VGLGRVHCLQGRFVDAKKALEDAMALQTRRLEKQNRATVETLMHLGFAFSGICKYQTAQLIFERVLVSWSGIFGTFDHILVALALTFYGDNFKQMANYPKAIEMHSKALKICRKLFGEKHHTVGDSLHYIGEVFIIQGNRSLLIY
jgi:tetratricopeptide (TPR) repeat protein